MKFVSFFLIAIGLIAEGRVFYEKKPVKISMREPVKISMGERKADEVEVKEDVHKDEKVELVEEVDKSDTYMHVLEIKGNKYFKAEAIEKMLSEVDKKSVRNIKEALFVTGFFVEINVEVKIINENHSITTIAVKEKPCIVNVRCHGNTLISTNAALQAMELYPGAIYDELKLDAKKEQ